MTAWQLLEKLLPDLVHIAGSPAQREVFEETLLFSLIKDKQNLRAKDLLDVRLARRHSAPDRRRVDALGSLIIETVSRQEPPKSAPAKIV